MFFNLNHLENYYKNLRTINGLSFSNREIDIIACILNGRTAYKEIANLLSISPRTVEVNKSNINKKIHAFKNCNIRNFLEKSDKYQLVKNHYTNLLHQYDFENTLNKISSLLKKQPSIFTTIYYDDDLKTSNGRELEGYLALLGITVHNQNIKTITQENISNNTKNNLLFILSQTYLDNIKILHNTYSNHLELIENLVIIPGSTVIFLYCDNIPKDMLEWLNSNSCTTTIITKSHFQENYYQAFFELLNKLSITSNIEIQKLVNSFTEEFQNNSVSPQDTSITVENNASEMLNILSIKPNLKTPIIVVFIILTLVLAVIYEIWFFDAKNTLLVRSDLIIPVESALLNRKSILDNINKKFDNKDDIHTIALIGPGGVGKTTLARQYALKQSFSIIWEINAESKITLIESFERLAIRLISNDEDRKVLEFLQGMQDSLQKEEEILNFVTQRLFLHPNWLLIYDNVGDIANIQKYIHPDSKAWGKGKIIITSRDGNIQYNKYINHTVQINELDASEKSTLFTKIISSENNKYKDPSNRTLINQYLETIPPFPLDVSLAAYYLKMTDISLETYFLHLKQYNKNFDNIQSSILKEAGDYSHTRYSIIASSLDNLIKIDQNFKKLLMFISVIDSQEIPRSLLDKYKNNFVIDNFIYYLKKYSLVTNESSPFLGATFSLHRTTQAIMLDYILLKLDLRNNPQVLIDIAYVFESYLQELMDEDDIMKIRSIQQHSNIFLSHKDILDDQSLGVISAQLGLISYYTSCNNMVTKQLLEDSLNSLNKLPKENELRIARISTYLGNIYRRLADYQKAELLLKHSVEIFKNHKGNNTNIARALIYLGMVYRDVGDFVKAKSISEESIMQYTNSTDFPDMKISSMADLAIILREAGEYDKAQKLWENILYMYNKNYNADHPNISWATIQFGILYRKIGDYKKAKNLLEQGLINYEKYYPKDHLHVSWIKVQLAALHRKLRDYRNAKELLETSIVNLEKYYPEDHPRVSWAKAHLGIVYIEMGYYNAGKILLEESLKNYRKYYPDNHPSIIWVFRHLNNTNFIKSE